MTSVDFSKYLLNSNASVDWLREAKKGPPEVKIEISDSNEHNFRAPKLKKAPMNAALMELEEEISKGDPN